MSPLGDALRYLIEMELHCFGVGVWQGKRRTSPASRADRAEQVDVLISLVGRLAWSRPSPRPLPDDAVLLADPGFILEPYFDRGRLTEAVQMSFQSPREVFLNASMISRSWPGWRGRALTWLNPSFFRSVPTYRSW